MVYAFGLKMSIYAPKFRELTPKSATLSMHP